MRKSYRNHKIVRVLMKILLVIVVLVFAVFLFIKIVPSFGGTATNEDKQNYEERADNYSNGKFRNEDNSSISKKADGTADNNLSAKGTSPSEKIPTIEPTFSEEPSITDFTVTWFGHSTLLIQMHGMNILIDPVFSERTSPVQFVGPKRFSISTVTIEELPSIDIVIISHDHYDHLDYKTILELDDKVDSYIVPLGVENHLERWGVESDKIQNMAWWEEIEVNGLTIGCTPSRHFSGRSLTDQYATLWASWVLKDDNNQVYESGDSGFGEHFEEIHNKYGDFDLAMLDCAQYDEKWANVHMTPEESYHAAEILKATVAMPIHWGAFRLANHPWDDPVQRFVQASMQGSVSVVTPMIGETMKLNEYEKYRKHWWNIIE